MTFYYKLKDTSTDKSQLYSVEALGKREADEVFIRNFFPMLPDAACMEIESVMSICEELDYELTCIIPTKAISLT